jgi:hypothetical protein
MTVCIYKKEEFVSSDREHILQNFLGTRWTSNQIVCNEVQKEFGETIDKALEQGFKEIRNLLGTKGGRGGEGPQLKNVDASDGNQYHLEPGGMPYIARPIIEIDGEKVTLAISSKSQLNWAIAEFNKRFPNDNFSVDELKANMVEDSVRFNSQIHLTPKIGGNEFFRGVLKSIFNLLGEMNPSVALMPTLDSVRAFIYPGKGYFNSHIRISKFFRFESVDRLGSFDHFICVFANGNCIDAVAQYFGSITYVLRLTDTYEGEKFCYSYLVDPCRESQPAEQRNTLVDASHLPNFNDGVPWEDQEFVLQMHGEHFSHFFQKHKERQDDLELSRIVNKYSRPDGSVATENQKDFIADLAHFIYLRGVKNPE